MSGDDPRLPDFVVLGAHRCALRWLRLNLDEHPDIHVPGSSIDHFSDRTGTRSLRTYRLAFRDAGDSAVIGECSPRYLLPSNDPRSMAERMDAAIPGLRLVAIVRDPVERMFSAFRDHVVHGRLPLDSDLLDMVRRDDREVRRLHLVEASRYGESLYPYWRRFRDRLLVVLDDDLRAEPAATYERILEHIGAPTGFEPRRRDWVLYSNAQTMWTKDAELSDEARRAAYMLFRSDVEELEAMTGRYFPAWDPGPPPPNWRELIGATPTARSADAAG
jgi:hypothetical protein